MKEIRMFGILVILSIAIGIVQAGRYQRYAPIGLGPRQEHSVAALNSSIYILGGVTYDDNATIQIINRVEVYDTQTNFWTVPAPLPLPMTHANTAVVNGKVYVLGALNAASTWVAIEQNFFYDPHNDSWTDTTPMPNGTWRASSAVGVYGSKIYLAGGTSYLQPFFGGMQNAFSTVSSYDTSTGMWDTSLPPLPAPRQHVGGAVVNHTFYVIGGRGENGLDDVKKTVFALDLENLTAGWKTLAPMPIARGGLACAALDAQESSKIYCLGGDSTLVLPNGVNNNNEVYDVETDSWEELEPMDLPRHGAGAVALNGQIYYPGGGTKSAGNPVGILDAYIP